jgi:hypothetical protein
VVVLPFLVLTFTLPWAWAGAALAKAKKANRRGVLLVIRKEMVGVFPWE